MLPTVQVNNALNSDHYQVLTTYSEAPEVGTPPRHQFYQYVAAHGVSHQDLLADEQLLIAFLDNYICTTSKYLGTVLRNLSVPQAHKLGVLRDMQVRIKVSNLQQYVGPWFGYDDDEHDGHYSSEASPDDDDDTSV